MPGIDLQTGPYTATFRADCSMLCASLAYRGEEYVTWPRTITEFRRGGATAIPPVHPWANRLGRWSYDAAGTHVDLAGVELPTDPNGLPIHGNMFGARFDVVRQEPARLTAQFDYGAQPEKLRAFPFPHVLTIDARLHAERGLTIRTAVRATGTTPVPVSFGWHPYLRLPHGGRAGWELQWPECEHVEVDARLIPTGERIPQAASRAPIARRTFDDHYALGTDRTFSLAAETRTLTVEFDDNYPFAQLYVPPNRQIAAIEPMVAEIDALGRGTAPLVAPSEEYAAEFTIRVSD